MSQMKLRGTRFPVTYFRYFSGNVPSTNRTETYTTQYTILKKKIQQSSLDVIY